MPFALRELSDLQPAPFDTLIDARSPSEFAEDHLPGAISLPVLDDAERARVGTIYVRQSRFGARKIGAALVLRNIAAHLQGPLADRDGAWQPLVYCWRGGQRSGTFTWLLREVGWRAEALEGGYRAYRRLVVRSLYDCPLPHRLVVLEGMTCTAKTDFLADLAAHGMQVLDLEGMACHRGSIFGGRAAPQPSQKAFEGRLAMALAALDPAQPVIIEAESSKVGDRIIPPSLWHAMARAPRVAVTAPLAARAAYFPDAYADLVADPDRFCALIAGLRRLHGADAVAQWTEMVRSGQMVALAGELMQRHYDPRYAKANGRYADRVVETVEAQSLDIAGRAAILPRLADALLRADNVARGDRRVSAGR